MRCRSLLVACSLPSLLAACGPAPPADVAPRASAEIAVRPWRVGVFLGLSGADAQASVEAKEGIQIAVEALNDAGGVRGAPLITEYLDDQSEAQRVPAAVADLLAAGSVALLGELSSSRARLGGVAAHDGRVPMLSIGATHPDVTRAGSFVFRACFTDSDQARAAAELVVKALGKKKVAVLFTSDEVSSALARRFEAAASELGATVVGKETFASGAAEVGAELRSLAARAPDYVYAPISHSNMVQVARGAKAAGLDGSRFVGAEGWSSKELLVAAAELEGALYTDHFAADAPWPAAQAFTKAYRKRYQLDPSPAAALGYDSARLLADALGRAKAATPDGLRQALSETKGFEGATGTLTMGIDRNPDKPVLVLQVRGKKVVYHSKVGGPAP